MDTSYEPTAEDLRDYAECRAARDREEQAAEDISEGDRVTMTHRIPGFYDNEICRVVRISPPRHGDVNIFNSVYVESLDEERFGWTAISNLVLYHG